MRTDASFVAHARGAITVLLMVLLPLAAMAQTPARDDSALATQLQIFQNLTREEQQAVLERMSSDGTALQADGADARRSATSGRNRTSGRNAVSGRAATAADRGALLDMDEEFIEPKLAPGDTVVLDVSIGLKLELAKQERPADKDDAAAREEARRLEALMSLVLSKNPYELDRGARLNLPGFAPIPLGDLTEEQAIRRLTLEPALAGLAVKLTRLPLDTQKPKPYGYAYFENTDPEFEPNLDLRVPADYVIGAGDQFKVQLYGNQNRSFPLPVSSDGVVPFPELGPIQVGGLTFSAARNLIESRVRSQMIGVQASVSMGSARNISVSVTGEAKWQGSYTVSGLATITTALFAAGGVSEVGSLRDVQLKRQSQLVRPLDLYDLLLGGDASGDARLLPGDVVFIPPVGQTVSVEGEVRRPAIYELRTENSIADLLRFAGGLTPEADDTRASLVRIDAAGRRVPIDVNFSDATGGGHPLRNGDALHVYPLRPQLDSGVVLEGFVHRPGVFEWREGMHLTDVLGSVDELKAGADQHYILIRRESGLQRRISLRSANLALALANRGSAADTLLAARDRIIVLDLAVSRERIVQPLLDELSLQSGLDDPMEVVSVEGGVRAPGEYPLAPGMRVAVRLRAGGGLDVRAYGSTAQLARDVINADGVWETRQLTINLAALRRGDAAANLELQSYDQLLIQETAGVSGRETVVLHGEVRLPGTYTISKGETLRQLLERAGGLTEQAFPEGGAFVRSDLRKLEQQELERLSELLRGELASLSIQAVRAGQNNSTETLLAGQRLLSDLQAAKATGRLVIDLPGLLAAPARSDNDILLRNGDELYIPKQRQEVTVIGEIQNATSHLYQRKLTRNDYIGMSGGLTRRADKLHAYVVRADGSVAKDRSIRPGDIIVVPVDAERMPRLPFWQAITQILYNLSLTVVALNSF